ncbi:MAG TPA: lantibiotic dehydratase [Thermoanaerobaculia bacterium]|nr:lantibiotic dehydratase [Thermoanaerobaculia bacterium]
MELLATVSQPERHKRRRLDGADFEPAGFFLLRTPLLPFDELAAWGARLRAPEAVHDTAALSEALAADRRELRGWLRDLLFRPAVIEALHVASPALLEALETWRHDPDSRKGRRAEESLVRYAIRMTSRATPFGMFAGCTIGRTGDRSRLFLGERSSYRRHSRLDTDYLFTLADELNQNRALRRSLRYRTNSSLYRAAGRLRYAEARLDGQMLSYHLVAVEPDDFLDAALARAAGGATPGEIAGAVAASDPDGEVSLEDAEGYVDELIDSQLVVSELWPAVTGAEAVHGMIETLEREGHGQAAVLRRTHEALEELDRQELGNDPSRYLDIARGLEPLPQRADSRRLYQVDLIKPGEVVLDRAVLDEIARGVEVLHRFASPDVQDALEGFRDRFIDRYGMGRLVPLVEALDEEAGVGVSSVGVGADTSPLLAGLNFGRNEQSQKVTWGPREELVLRKLTEALAAGAPEIEITDEDLARLETPKRPPLPDSFQAMAMVGAADEGALAAGDFRVYLKSAFGPSGARIAGRFCHADEEIARLVSDHLQAEEALDPDAAFAEVVHLPSGRTGNVAARPVLRGWEIPYLGVSGAPRERQIPLDDLRITVEGPEVALYSARTGRRVLPRLTSAHNYVFGSLSVYRFLCSLQAQGVRTGLQWYWRPFDALPFLPRVRCGRVVLSRASWRITPEEIKSLAERRESERYAAVQQWREQRGIPRRVLLADEDIELFVDFDNVLSLDAFLAIVRTRDDVVVSEMWPDYDELPVRGPEGRFVHEIMVPFERRRTPVRRRAPSFSAGAERILPPTSRWLYLKLYTGAATADVVLRDAIAPLVAQALESGAADRWFFLRYGDPQWHLRVRFGGEPERLRGVIDLLGEHLDPALRDGQIWRWQLDTYEREVERYGGPAGVELSERIFHVDSEAVLAALQDLAGDRGADVRWRLALVGIDRLLGDFGFDLVARRDLLAMWRAGFGAELETGAELNRQLAQRLRATGEELYDLLTHVPGPDHPLAGGYAALDARSAKLAPLVAELRALESRGELTVPVADLAASYVHMFVNRLIRSDQRAHELVLYDLLHRLTMSRLVREGRGKVVRGTAVVA